MRYKSFSIIPIILSISLFLFTVAVSAQEVDSTQGDGSSQPLLNRTIQYAAQFTCGANPQATPRVLPGQYATSVNIHNPEESPVVFRKRIALTFPPPAQEPGMVSDPIEDELGPMEALKVACDEIPSQFFPGVPDLPPYVHGFLIIESPGELNVTAVYTTGTAEAVQSIDVEEVKGKRISVGSINPSNR